MKLVHVEAAAVAQRAEPGLSLVPAAPAGERANQLLQEARAAALEHLHALKAQIEQTRACAQSIVRGGDLYTVGLHDLAGRLAEELDWRGKTLEALIERQAEAGGVRRPTFRGVGS